MTDPLPAVDLRFGDCLAVLCADELGYDYRLGYHPPAMPDNSVSAVITDPPYGLADHKPATVVAALTAWCAGDREHVPSGKGFMGRDWDAFVPPPAVWDECLRVLRPGGHLLAFAAPRTADLMGISIRLAGFEMRDTIMWTYGSGMPKGQNVAKSTKDERWEGWNTSLKPAQEPIIVARKPFPGTVAATVLAHGTGAINVDACRVVSEQDRPNPHGRGGIFLFDGFTSVEQLSAAADRGEKTPKGRDAAATLARYREWQKQGATAGPPVTSEGRWPSNVVFVHDADCAEVCADACPVAELDRQSEGTRAAKPSERIEKPAAPTPNAKTWEGGPLNGSRPPRGYTDDQGGASRFFPTFTFKYQAKAPSSERPRIDGKGWPTVKPLELMRWLVRLVTPPGGLVLDPFAGSGATLQAAEREGFASIGIERDEFAWRLIHVRLGREDPGEVVTVPVEIVPVEVVEVPVVEVRHDLDDVLRESGLDPVLTAIAVVESIEALVELITSADRATWTDEHTAAVLARQAELESVAA